MKRNTLQMPGKIVIEQQTDDYGVFSWGPLQKGFVYSLGNGLRRVLLSSIEGYAITKIKLPHNVPHEFGVIEGVVEDMTDIILNLKRLHFKKNTPEPESTFLVQVKNKKVLKGSDIQEVAKGFDIINPDLVICHLDESMTFEIELTVESGRGYSLAEDHKPKEQTFGEVAIDALFSPVVNVELKREDALVGSRADYEKLVIIITTNGAKKPEDALREAASILREHFTLFAQEKITSAQEDQQKEERIDQEIEDFRSLLQTPIEQLDLLPRAENVLKSNKIRDLGQIVTMTVADFMKLRNCGKKTIEELKEMLEARNLSFGMDIKGYRRGEDHREGRRGGLT